MQDAILINQVSTKDKIPRKPKRQEYTYCETGIAKSRNRAISHAQDEICLFSDDDVVFVDDAASKITAVFSENPDADIITFQIGTPERELRKKYPKRAMRQNLRTITRVSAIEIAFRLSSVKNANLLCDERFGLGAMYPTGEENIFLRDAIIKGLRVRFSPVTIAIHPVESSGRNLYSTELLFGKGAMCARMFGWSGALACILFAIKKKPDRTFWKTSRIMLSGWKRYLSDK